MTDVLDLPLGLLLDLIAVQQIKQEGAKQKRTALDEEAEFLRLLSYK